MSLIAQLKVLFLIGLYLSVYIYVLGGKKNSELNFKTLHNQLLNIQVVLRSLVRIKNSISRSCRLSWQFSRLITACKSHLSSSPFVRERQVVSGAPCQLHFATSHITSFTPHPKCTCACTHPDPWVRKFFIISLLLPHLVSGDLRTLGELFNNFSQNAGNLLIIYEPKH